MPSVQSLIEQLQRPGWKFWISPERAADQLAALGPAAVDAIPALVDRLVARASSAADDTSRSRVVKGSYANALVAAGPAAAPELLKHFDTTVEGIRYVAVEVAARLGAAAAPVLIDALAGENKRVQANAAWALRGIGAAAAEAVPALEHALAIALKPDAVRLALDSRGRMQKIEIRHEYTDRDIAFLDSLSTGGKAPDKPFKLRDHDVALACAAALEAMGSAAVVAVPTLIYALEAGKDDLTVRISARNALERATGQKFGEDPGKWREWVKARSRPQDEAV